MKGKPPVHLGMNFTHIKSAKNAKPADDVHNIPTYGVNHPKMSTPNALCRYGSCNMTLLNSKNLELCIAISLFLYHVRKKWRFTP
jgi:hypothetical protein